jgi:hypothetical protein
VPNPDQPQNWFGRNHQAIGFAQASEEQEKVRREGDTLCSMVDLPKSEPFARKYFWQPASSSSGKNHEGNL